MSLVQPQDSPPAHGRAYVWVPTLTSGNDGVARIAETMINRRRLLSFLAALPFLPSALAAALKKRSYRYTISTTDDVWILTQRDGPVVTVLDSGRQTWSAGDVMRLELSGGEWTVKRNGNVISRGIEAPPKIQARSDWPDDHWAEGLKNP